MRMDRGAKEAEAAVDRFAVEAEQEGGLGCREVSGKHLHWSFLAISRYAILLVKHFTMIP